MGWDPIASYFIETIFYNQLQYHKDKDTVNEFLRSSKTGLFMQVNFNFDEIFSM